MDINIGDDWKSKLSTELKKAYFIDLIKIITNAYKTKIIYPAKPNIFKAFLLCPFSRVKVVILGQDPYHGPNQAQGLSFSVPEDQKIPPSLRNIFKELETDIGTSSHHNGDLTTWSKQGVLLLNTVLTVEIDRPNSHQGLGWEIFTDTVIKIISDQKEQVVFILWGKYAEAKKSLIDETKHLVLIAPHPSPFSAYTGFFGCRHFSKTNIFLSKTGQLPIDW